MEVRPEGTAPSTAIYSVTPGSVAPYGTDSGQAADGGGDDVSGGGADTPAPASSGDQGGEESACPCVCWCSILWPFSGVPVPIRLVDFAAGQDSEAAEARPADSATLETLLSPQDVTTNDPAALVRAGMRTAMTWYRDAYDLAIAAGLAPIAIGQRAEPTPASRVLSGGVPVDVALGPLPEYSGPPRDAIPESGIAGPARDDLMPLPVPGTTSTEDAA